MRKNAFARKGIGNALSKNALWANALLLPMLLLTGCDFFGDACDKCQDAIDHMYSKVATYDCDAALMQNAVNRIREDCEDADANANYIIQSVLENCSGGSLAPPLCPSPGTGIGMELSIVRTEDDPVDSGIGDVELVVQLLSAGGSDKVKSYFMDEGFNATLSEWTYDDGDQVSFQLFDPFTDNALTPVATADLRVRSMTRMVDRGVRIRYNAAFDDYSIDFQFW